MLARKHCFAGNLQREGSSKFNNRF